MSWLATGHGQQFLAAVQGISRGLQKDERPMDRDDQRAWELFQAAMSDPERDYPDTDGDVLHFARKCRQYVKLFNESRET